MVISFVGFSRLAALPLQYYHTPIHTIPPSCGWLVIEAKLGGIALTVLHIILIIGAASQKGMASVLKILRYLLYDTR